MKRYIIGTVTGVALSIAGVTGASAAMHAGDRPIVIDDHHDGAFVDFGTKWGSPVFGTGASVTWSLTATGVDAGDESAGLTLTHLDDFMPIGYKVLIEAAFAAWSAIADITFTEVADNGLPFNAVGATGDIRISGHAFDGIGGILAHGFYPPPNGDSAAGDIHFDIDDQWDLGQGLGGFDIFTVAAHEIGHAIGLEHTGVADSLMNPFYSTDFYGLQPDDIAGARYIYGPAAVPVPAALPLLMAGLAMVGFVGRRKRAA